MLKCVSMATDDGRYMLFLERQVVSPPLAY